MRIYPSLGLSVVLLVTACATPQTQHNLDAATAACQAGNPQACDAARALAAQAHVEATQNAAIGIGTVAALAVLGLTIAGAAHGYPHGHPPRPGGPPRPPPPPGPAGGP